MGKKKSGRTGGIRVEVKGSTGADTIRVASQSTSRAPINGSASATNLVTRPASNTAITKASSVENVALEVDVESPLEKMMSKAVDEASLKTFAQAWNKTTTEKAELRAVNSNVSYEEFEKLISDKKLDSNLKKCTGFVRKMKLYSEPQKSSIENDIKVLNLSKYLTEIAAAVTEARFKVGDVQDVVTICSWIHQRYPDFASMLLENYKKSFPGKKTDLTGAVLSKLSVDLRMIGDLVICGVLPMPDGFNVVGKVIQTMIAIDKEGTQCVIPVLSFCRGLGDDFIGLLPRSLIDLCKEYNVELIRSSAFPEEKKTLFRRMVEEYYSTVKKSLEKMNDDLINSELHNRKLLRNKGEIPEDRKEAHLGIFNKFEKFYSSVEKFADIVNQELPHLPSLPADPEEEEEKAMLLTKSGEQLTAVPGIVVFEDEETRSFYQDFKDLKVHLPPVAYRDSIQQAAEQTQAIAEREKALDNFDDELEEAELKGESSVDDDISPDADEEVLPSTLTETEEKEIDQQIKPNFQAFLTQLPNCVNRNMIDQAAINFAENFNTKNNRKKIVKVPRQRMDLLPFYARLVAVLHPVMPDIGIELCDKLKKDFRFLVRKKHQIFVETKIKITRFIGELVNFRIFPKSDALQCFKILLMDFVHHQVEMACVFVETCGRILYRTPDSHRRMKIYLEEMQRKKAVKSMEPRYVSLIDHAYYFVVPPEGAQKTIKIKTPLECFLQQILIDDLKKETVDETVIKLLKLDWNDDDVADLAIKYLTMPWKLTNQQLPWYAEVLAGVYKYEPQILVQVVDTMLEEIRRGMEHPVVRHNFRRFVTIQYMGDLYYWRLVTSGTMFTILYYIITFGVNMDASNSTSLDPGDNLFRVRLACLLLKVSGQYLIVPKYKKRLRTYLLYLQRYFWFKRSLPVWSARTFPFGIQEMWEETAKALNRRMKLANSYEEAQQAVNDLEAELEKKKRVVIKRRKGNEKINLEIKNRRCSSLATIKEKNDDEHGFSAEGINGRRENSITNNERNDRNTDYGSTEYTDDAEKLLAQNSTFSLPSPRYDNGDSTFSSSPLFGKAIGWGGGSLFPVFPQNDCADPPLDPYEDYEKAAAAMKAAQDNITEEDEEFINMFEKMCSEVNYSATRDGGKHMKTDIAIPLHIRNSSHSTSNTSVNGPQHSGRSVIRNDGDTVAFTLITRKGKKQEYKSLPVPADSDFVKRIKSREDAERAEKESVKKRTLAISKLQEDEEREKEHVEIKTALERKPITSEGMSKRESECEVEASGGELSNLSLVNHSEHMAWVNHQREMAHELHQEFKNCWRSNRKERM